MKKLIASGLMALLLAGCASKHIRDAKLDGTLVKDEQGRLWQLEAGLGDTFFLNEVKTNSFLQAR